MNIQKSASVLEPLSIPGAFVFPLKSRSWVFKKGGFGWSLHCLAWQEGDDYFLFLNIKKKKRLGWCYISALCSGQDTNCATDLESGLGCIFQVARQSFLFRILDIFSYMQVSQTENLARVIFQIRGMYTALRFGRLLSESSELWVTLAKPHMYLLHFNIPIGQIKTHMCPSSLSSFASILQS